MARELSVQLAHVRELGRRDGRIERRLQARHLLRYLSHLRRDGIVRDAEQWHRSTAVWRWPTPLPCLEPVDSVERMWQYKEEAEERREPHSEERAGMMSFRIMGRKLRGQSGLFRCFTHLVPLLHLHAPRGRRAAGAPPTPTAAAAAAVAAAAHPRAASLATPYRCVHTAVLATPTLSCRPCGASQEDHDLGCGHRPEPARARRLRGCVGGDLLAVLNH